jgi:hypothetical protein
MQNKIVLDDDYSIHKIVRNRIISVKRFFTIFILLLHVTSLFESSCASQGDTPLTERVYRGWFSPDSGIALLQGAQNSLPHQLTPLLQCRDRRSRSSKSVKEHFQPSLHPNSILRTRDCVDVLCTDDVTVNFFDVYDIFDTAALSPELLIASTCTRGGAREASQCDFGQMNTHQCHALATLTSTCRRSQWKTLQTFCFSSLPIFFPGGETKIEEPFQSYTALVMPRPGLTWRQLFWRLHLSPVLVIANLSALAHAEELEKQVNVTFGQMNNHECHALASLTGAGQWKTSAIEKCILWYSRLQFGWRTQFQIASAHPTANRL